MSSKSQPKSKGKSQANRKRGKSTAKTPTAGLNHDLMVFRHLFASVTEEMGEALRQSAVSPNIKERFDFSCALLDAGGRLVAHAAHIPVHLGSAHMTVPAILEEMDPQPGDVIILNDPHRGGTHLNDITVVAPYFADGKRIGFLMNRAHHADVGGAEPGSMSGARDIYGEGFLIPPLHLQRDGQSVPEVWQLLQANVRDPQAARGDLQAQCAALHRGAQRLQDLCQRFGADGVQAGMAGLLHHGERLTRALLKSWPNGKGTAVDYMDGEQSPRLQCSVKKKGDQLLVDFHGTSLQVGTSWNTHEAVATSAIFYVLQALSPAQIPETSGTFKAVRMTFPEASLVSSQAPAGVAIGNVETSQRIVDVLLAALRSILPQQIPANSQGTMNNLLFGGRRADGRPFVYYETLGGGAGACAEGHGASAVQVHMTNTRNTPVEVFEQELPVRVHQLGLRRRSGGSGSHRGGEGLIKQIEFLEPARVTITGTRRQQGAAGAKGGGAGKKGVEHLRRSGSKKWSRLQPGQAIDVQPGDQIRIQTPGGGGWGATD